MQMMGHNGDERAQKPNRNDEATPKLTTAGGQRPPRAAGHRGMMVLPKPRSQDHPARARTTAEAAQQEVRPRREVCPAGI